MYDNRLRLYWLGKPKNMITQVISVAITTTSVTMTA